MTDRLAANSKSAAAQPLANGTGRSNKAPLMPPNSAAHHTSVSKMCVGGSDVGVAHNSSNADISSAVRTSVAGRTWNQQYPQAPRMEEETDESSNSPLSTAAELHFPAFTPAQWQSSLETLPPSAPESIEHSFALSYLVSRLESLASYEERLTRFTATTAANNEARLALHRAESGQDQHEVVEQHRADEDLGEADNVFLSRSSSSCEMTDVDGSSNESRTDKADSSAVRHALTSHDSAGAAPGQFTSNASISTAHLRDSDEDIDSDIEVAGTLEKALSFAGWKKSTAQLDVASETPFRAGGWVPPNPTTRALEALVSSALAS